MHTPRRCWLALALLPFACSKDPDDPVRDAGSDPAGKGGDTSSETGGAGRLDASAGKGEAGSAAQSGKGAAGASGAAAESCKADCEAGEHCELVQVACVRAPCPPLPMCVPDRSGGEVDCDPRHIMCKRVAPECPEGQVPRVDGACFGDCVAVDACACTEPEACPLPEKYTCHMSAKHCTPYLR